MSKGLQDTFIVDDDEEETCPLCVEEFDLTDKGFKPCPCGYQICQFCYNNVKNNMNGLCPACRRPYNDADIQYKLITPEETAAHKSRQAQKLKKTQQLLQKERQRAEADSLSRKHLAGLRVVQKNLVYVTGLSPNVDEDELLQTLRGKEYFGQYGRIIKIVVSKARDKHDSVGVYVTYELKDDAASCIAAVDGSPNGERILRAQFGTTKYCSAYLRGDTCTNRSCMFLHEPGEANESYSRADLSALNAGSTQHGGSSRAPPQSQQPVSAAQPMVRQPSDQPTSPVMSERPGLPSTASWASKPVQTQVSRAESRVPSGSIGSPAPFVAAPVAITQEPVPTAPQSAPSVAAQSASPTELPLSTQVAQVTKPSRIIPINEYMKSFSSQDLRMAFSTVKIDAADLDIIMSYPALFEPDGGAKRRARRLREEEQRRQEAEAQTQALEDAEDVPPEMSGSLQLGGEPEEPLGASLVRSSTQASGQEGALDRRFQFGAESDPSPNVDDQDLTNQHDLLLRQTLKSPNLPTSFGRNNFQQQAQLPGHARNASRFDFANDHAGPAANKALPGQKAGSNATAGNAFEQQTGQPQGSQFFTNNVQGPPPGLKTTGTPPVSGGMTFGQGHGFTTGGTQYGAGGRNVNDEMMRELMRGRNASITSASDAAKREYTNLPFNYNSPPGVSGFSQAGYQTPAPYPSMSPFGGDGEKQRGSKKKTKKHRHGTPSSSSGGHGMVDGHSDPHLLLSRGQYGGVTSPLSGAGPYGSHQPTGYGGGHGGGGVAHDTNFPPLGGHHATPVRTASISSLAQLQDPGSRRSTPTVPPGFEAEVSRQGTPALPPGLGAKPLTALPDLEGLGSRPSSRASLKRVISGAVVPITPLRPGTPASRAVGSRAVSRAASPDRKVEGKGEIALDTPTKKPKPATVKPTARAVESVLLQNDGIASVKEVSKENVKPSTAPQKILPTESLQAVAGAQQVNEYPPLTASVAPMPSKQSSSAPTSKSSAAIEQAAKAPLEPMQSTMTSKVESSKVIIPPTQSTKPSDAQASYASTAPTTAGTTESSTADASAKRKHPGKLDIAAAVEKQKALAASATVTATPTASTPSLQSKSVAQTPSVADDPNVSAPPSAVKPLPRTLRVVQTPKTETPTVATPPPVLPPLVEAVVKRLPSRQPSVASMNFPGTPSSEQVSMSDNISMTSTSMSRANSPPPSKVGAAPIRAKTKAQQRKERKERAQVIDDEIARVAQEKSDAAADEPVIEAIVSRKKKEPKAKEVKAVVKPKSGASKVETKTADTTPTASRPVSPAPKAIAKLPEPPAPAVQKPSTPVKASPPPSLTRELSPPPTPTLSPLQIIADLHTRNPEIHTALENFFRSSTAASLKATQHIILKDLADPSSWTAPDFNIKLTREEVDELLAESIPAIRYGGEDGRIWDRGLVTPTGAHLRALSQDLERRFLELETDLRHCPDMLKWRPTKPQDQVRLPAFDLEALRAEFEISEGRGVSVMEQMVQDGSAMKKGAFLVDEAARYINEFVMPPATPPPQQQQQGKQGQAKAGAQGGDSAVTSQSVEFTERALVEARRAADEKEGALRRVIRRNKKMLGLA
ncbi:hypothetical protein B0A48_18334 [Cryoendolithus antarcticus]|uniref:RING-type domain-containing protein n=1 Tax=Cryoendolithus antarcticus TaxID=1507870 RepID=A0A1V8S913_9PEZI|nr:hypothetical protein B0A48_18334 [Cryoendolithus antarcticus]